MIIILMTMTINYSYTFEMFKSAFSKMGKDGFKKVVKGANGKTMFFSSSSFGGGFGGGASAGASKIKMTINGQEVNIGGGATAGAEAEEPKEPPKTLGGKLKDKYDHLKSKFNLKENEDDYKP